MAVALSSGTSLSSVLFSTVKFRSYSLRHTPIIASLRCNSSKSNHQKKGVTVGHKKHSKDERPTRGNAVEPQTTSSKSFGIQRKNKDLMFDSKDQQVHNTCVPFLFFRIEVTWCITKCKVLQ